MEKVKKYILITIISIVSLYALLVVIDIFRFMKGGNEPIIVLDTYRYEYDDGYVVQYISLGYEFIHSLRTSDKGWYYNIGFSKLESKLSDNSAFTIYYDGDYDYNCVDKNKQVLYEDEKYIYYIDCGDVTKINVRVGEYIYTLEDALDRELISINDVTASGFKVLIDIKGNE